MDTTHFREMEARARRKGVTHPDQCPKLRLQGVDFAIPPRGVQIVPTFDDEGKATLTVEGVEQWPEIEGLLARLAGYVTDDDELAIDCDKDAELICELMTLARKVLLVQYELTNEQLSSLLAMSAGFLPTWVAGLIQWANGFAKVPIR